MNNQHPGMSQPRPRQQAPLNETQLYVLKQLQELQRQKQLGHVDQQDGRYQNQMNHLAALAKQAANNQLPIVNGMPIHGSANYAWQNEQAGGGLPNNSQMYVMGNANWAQHGGYSGMQAIPEGLLSNQQGQVFRQGMVSQHNDQPSYGARNDNIRGSLNQYSHLQGIPQDSANALNKGSGNRLEKPVMQSLPLHNSLQGGQSALLSNQGSMNDGMSVSRQGFQGKNVFGQVPFQGRSSGIQPGNSMHVNSVSMNAPVQEYRGREVQAGWSGNLHERAVSQFGSSQGMVGLDPTEKKILFSSDDNSWDAPGSKGGVAGTGGYANSLESEDPLNAFPSLQSGTWSALMQSAVAEASSSDTGLQDEWSGLNFPKDSSTVDQPLPVADSNLHSASSLTSRSFPLFDDGKASQSGRSPDFQQPGTRNLHEQTERMQHDTSYEPMQQSLNDSGKWLDHTQQKALIQGNHQMHPSMNSRNAMQNAWARQMQSESAGHATNMAIDSHNGQGSWVHQQRIPSPNVSSPHTNNTTVWENNSSLAASGDASMKLRENDNSGQRLQRNDFKMGMHVEKDHSGGLMITNSFPNSTNDGSGHHVRSTTIQNSSTATNQQILNYQKHMVESPVQQREDGMVYTQKLVGSQSVQQSMYNSDRASGETYDKKQENSFQKEFSNDSYNSTQSQPTVTGGGFRENSWLSTSDSRPMASANQKSSGQAPSQQGFQGSKGHERECYGNTEFNSHTANNSVAMEKEHITAFQGNERGSASSDGSAGTFPQSNRTVQTCQNMLQLFHNVDQSAEHGTPARFSSSDRTVMPEAEGSDSSVARQWQNQPTASRGFGLRLGPPSQRIPVTNQALNSQNSSQVNSLNLRQMDSKVEEKGQIWMSPGASPQSLPHEITQRERWDNTPNISSQNGNETSQLNMQASVAAAFTASHPYSRNNLQSQQSYRTSDKSSSNLPVNVSNIRPGPSNRQTPGAYGEVVADQSVLPSLPGTSNRSSFAASPSEDTTSSDRVTGQQYTVLDSVPVSRPSAVSGKSSQGDYSAMLQQVLASASAPQHLTGGPPSKGPPNFFRSSSPSGNNMERTSSPAEKLEHNDTNKGLNAPEFIARSSNPQGFAGKEEQSVKESSWKQIPTGKSDLTPHRTGAFAGQDSARRHPVEAKSMSSASLHTHPHHQEYDRGRYGKEPAMATQRENPSFRSPTTSTRDIEAFGRTLRPGNQNYSLLHQVQSMKSVENDQDSRGGKRFKGADGGDTDAQQLSNRAGQQLLEGHNAIVRDTVHSGTNALVQHTSLSSGDAKMLKFSSEGREDKNVSTANHTAFGVTPSQDLSTSNRDESHNRSSQPSMSSVRSENPHINTQMAPTWFDRYGVIKPEQILPTQNAQSTVKSISPFNFGKGSEVFVSNSSKEHLNAVDATQAGNACQSMARTIVHSENLIQMQSQPLESNNQNLPVVRPKKRKTEKPMLMPWHKEISRGSQRLQTTSMAEEDWAYAANRLVEKQVEDESEFGDDGLSLVRSRKRLVYTTQLMQQILRAPAAEILSTKASSDYETVTYSVAKVALGEACGLIANSAVDSHPSIANETQEMEKLKPTEKIPDQYFSRGVEEFIGKAKKLETELLRLDKRASVMDIRVECQDLERFSVINRFAKFHGQRNQADAESSSGAVSQRPLPQRYVTAHAMPRNLPGGVHCLSL
ncbi:hypothetical protein ACHQM5_006561 [Ranunculus cassubicifolius]